MEANSTGGVAEPVFFFLLFNMQEEQKKKETLACQTEKRLCIDIVSQPLEVHGHPTKIEFGLCGYQTSQLGLARARLVRRMSELEDNIASLALLCLAVGVTTR